MRSSLWQSYQVRLKTVNLSKFRRFEYCMRKFIDIRYANDSILSHVKIFISLDLFFEHRIILTLFENNHKNFSHFILLIYVYYQSLLHWIVCINFQTINLINYSLYHNPIIYRVNCQLLHMYIFQFNILTRVH